MKIRQNLAFFIIIVVLSFTFITGGCTKRTYVMPSYTPEPFDAYNGHCYAVVDEWNEHPYDGSYFILFDLDEATVVRRIPLQGMQSFLCSGITYYWNKKYCFLASDYGWNGSSYDDMVVIDSETGRITKIPVSSSGTISGITGSGKLYILSPYVSNGSLVIESVDVGRETTSEATCSSRGPAWMIGEQFIYPSEKYSYAMANEGGPGKAYIMGFNTDTDNEELIYDLDQELGIGIGTVGSDGKIYLTVTPRGMDDDDITKYPKNAILVIDPESRSLLRTIDMPDAKWIFGDIGENAVEKDWYVSTACYYNGEIYLLASLDISPYPSRLFKCNINTGEFENLFETYHSGRMSTVNHWLVIDDNPFDRCDKEITVIDLTTDATVGTYNISAMHQ